MAELLYSVTGSSLQLETVQDYIDFDIYSNVIEPSVIADSYTCHICTISMPLNSVSAHLSSYIHRMSLAVAELAAERLNRQTSEPIPLFQWLPPDTILCQTCGVLVEDNHTCPKKSTTREKALTTFLKTYQNTVAENIASETGVDDDVARVRSPNNVLTNSTENESDASDHDLSGVGAEWDIEGADSEASDEVIDNEINGESTACSNEVPYADDSSHIDTSCIENRHIRNQIAKRENVSEEEIQMLKYYGYLFEDQEYTHKILVHNAEYVDIVTPMGDWVRVTEDNYHGFYTVNGKILCRVCRYLVRDKSVHMRTEDHMDRIRCPLTDQNCVRQINLLWNHCVLCNEIIENIEYHVMCNEGHEAALSSALIAPGCLPVPVDASTEFELVECKLCSVTLKKEDMRHHAASSAHKKRLQEKRLQLGDGDPMFNHHLQMIHGRFYCRVCQFEISENLIVHHLANDNHKILCQQYTIKQEQSKIQCKVSSEDCVTNIRDSTTSGLHSESDSTISTINQLQNVTGMSVSSDPIISQLFKYGLLVALNKWKTCKICYISFDDWQSHLQSVEHGYYFDIYMNVHQIEGSSPHYKCAPCNLPLAPNNVIDHIIEKNHNLYGTYMSRVHSERPIAYMDSQTEGFIELIGVGNDVYCNACKYTFLNRTAQIYEHVRGATHRANSGYK